MKAQTEHIPSLDGLRACAVLMVLWAHVPVVSTPGVVRLLRSALNPGYFGVDLFFVLSGFLITRILLVDRENGRPLRLFLARRALRIFPIYYLLLALLLLIKPGQYLAWCAVYLSNFHFMFDKTPNPLPHTWSLAVEEHFYLVWPPIVHFCAVRRSRAIGIALLVVAIVAAVATVLLKAEYPTSWIGIARDPIYRGSIYRFGSLLLGALFAYHEGWLRSRPKRLWRVAGLLASLGVMFVVVSKLRETIWFPLESMVGFAALSGATLLGTLAVSAQSATIGRVLQHPLLTYIGRISYGLYLYHFAVYYWFGLSYPKGAPTLTSIALAIVTSFAVAAVSFRFIEQPLLALKSRFR